MTDIPIQDGQLLWDPHFFSEAKSDAYFERLQSSINWRQEKIQMFGRWLDQPRLTAWHGDPNAKYTYSSLSWEPEPWTEALQEIREAVEKASGGQFNSVLLNLYRHGQDSMGWHSDDEPELGSNPLIASVSFGEARRFHLKHKSRKDLDRIRMDLGHGSLLVMGGALQHHWQHQISKTAKPVSPRMNLTFRWIVH